MEEQKKLDKVGEKRLYCVEWADGDDSLMCAISEEDVKGRVDVNMIDRIVDRTYVVDPLIEEAKREVAREILDQMSLERCDPAVMPYFEDYYWLSKSIWLSLEFHYLESNKGG